jgi:hypothetical protein
LVEHNRPASSFHDCGHGTTEEALLKQAVRILAILFFALSLSAQLRTGDVQGRVVDKAGKPLPRVAVTLSRPLAADQRAVTGPSGVFRFPAVFPGADYSLKAELAEFKTAARSGVVVTLGGRVAVDLVLEPGKAEETVSVAAPSPVIDKTRFTSGASFAWGELQILPTARDPWAIVQLVPSVMLDRENVGGNESADQAHFVGKGDGTNGIDNTWSVDGIAVSDPLDLGRSGVSFDFDTIDTIAVTTGGARDVSLQTGGIAVSLLTRRGGNKIGGAARFFWTDNAFQSSNLTTDLQNGGIPNTNRIQQFRDFGANAGGPIAKNKVWFWGAYGVQDLFIYSIYDVPDRTQFSNYSFKLNAEPFSGNKAEALFTTSSKERFGANATVSKPEGNHETGRFRLGSPIFKLQDEQVVGNDFYVSVKAAWMNSGVNSIPALDEDLRDPVTYDIARGVYVPFSAAYNASWDYSRIVRANRNIQLSATLYKDELFGLAHEIKGGLEFSKKRATSVSGFPQNYEVFRNFTDPLIDLGEGLVVPPAGYQLFVLNRENRRADLADQASGYLQDTITKGRLTLQLGLRYDRQRPSTGPLGLATAVSSWSNIFSPDSVTNLSTYFPSLIVNAVNTKYQWSTWSPRIGLSWDLKGDGRTVLKMALSQYGDILSAGDNVPRPLGLTGNLAFWWNDADADSVIDLPEMLWKYSALHPDTPNQLYSLFGSAGGLTEAAVAALVGGFESDAFLAGNYQGFDWANRSAINYDNLTTFFRSDIDPNAKNVKTSPRTREIMLSLEKELGPDLGASAAATFRRYDNFDWEKPFYPADIYPSTPDLVIDNTATWFTVAGTVPQTITVGEDETIDLGEAGGRPWYLPVATFPGNTPYRMVDKSTAYRTYIGLDLAVTKRLSHHWFLNASLTLQDQRVHWGDSFIDPTNQWAVDGKPYGNLGSGAGGKISVQMYSRWLAKLSGLYQLPWGFDVSATWHAREGWKIPNYITLAYANSESWPGLYRSNTVYLQSLAKDSLPVFNNLSFRIEKTISLGTGRMVLMADVFNALNTAVVNRAYDAYLGTYYVDTEVFSANPFNRLYNEALNPRVWRFGVRFEF